MAAAVPRKLSWWQGQESSFSSESSNSNPSFSRPAITTGATLPWGGKSNSSLGPPRAFYAGHASIPTITVSSCQPGMTNFVCKGEPASAIPPSPFAASADKEYVSKTDAKPSQEETHLKTEGSESEAAAMTHYQRSDEIPSDTHAKQSSLRSGGTSVPAESRQPSIQRQIITTAQDEQGLAMTLGQSFPRQKDVGRKSVRHNPFHQTGKHPFPQAAIVTTNSSLQPVNDLRTPILVEPDKQLLSLQSLPLDEDFAPEELLEKGKGLPSVPAPISMIEEYQQEEKLQHCDSFGLDVRGTDVEAEDGAVDQEERRRIRRRNNNRESAKRVREKRDADLKTVNNKIAKLQESQAQLLDHCNTMDNACQQLHQELDQMRSRYESGQAENLRLRAEVEHLRKNLQVGEQSDMGVKVEPQEGTMMRSSVSEIFAPLSEDMMAGMPSSSWDPKSYDPLIDQYLTFAGFGSAPSLDYISGGLPDSQSML